MNYHVKAAIWGMVIGGLFPLAFLAQAQIAPVKDNTVKPDSMRHYDLEEIVVSTPGSLPQETYTVQRIALRELERQNAVVVSDFVRSIPAAFIQTNSRGESLIYLRNAGERQVALFFNGASMNVPWDNRLHLDMIPAAMVGGITIAKGVPSILYGTNVLGGAINMTSRRLDGEGDETHVNAQYGSLEDIRIGVGHLYHKGPLHVGVSAGYTSRSGIPLADRSSVPFSQPDERLRTNTDRELINLFGHADYRFKNGIQTGLSLMHIEGQFGVAPESHLDPTSATVRFWRYPVWNNTMAIVNSTVPIGVATVLKGAFWAGQFGQTIDQFDSVDYRQVEAQQADVDQTAGMRLSMLRSFGAHQLTLAANGLTSTHEEITSERDETGRFVSENGTQLYRQHVFSAGAEWSFRLADPLMLIAGGSVDGIATPLTGDKPGRDPLVDYAMNAGLSYTLTPSWVLRASAGRKVRFPTMRELFGESLNRFLLNPNLRPESSIVSELGLATQQGAFHGEFAAFYYRVHDTIDQQTVDVDGRRLRQRINLDGSRVGGVEVAARYALNTFWTIEGHSALLRTRGIQDGETTRLTEKPDVLSALSLEYDTERGIAFMMQGEYTGRAYGRNEDNTLEALPRVLAIDARASYGFVLPGVTGRRGEVFIRGDNLTDASVLPQLGLPAPGRTVSAGVSLTL
ncbi:MAG: TonB-dependent receptor [Rhodothermales bacterium]|nr:TonB-dependent receptor [Rhodothermales bacterium]